MPSKICDGGCGKWIGEGDRCIVFTRDKYSGEYDETFALGKNLPLGMEGNMFVSCLDTECRRRVFVQLDGY
jgi:hypothetical protein